MWCGAQSLGPRSNCVRIKMTWLVWLMATGINSFLITWCCFQKHTHTHTLHSHHFLSWESWVEKSETTENQAKPYKCQAYFHWWNISFAQYSETLEHIHISVTFREGDCLYTGCTISAHWNAWSIEFPLHINDML